MNPFPFAMNRCQGRFFILITKKRMTTTSTVKKATITLKNTIATLEAALRNISRLDACSLVAEPVVSLGCTVAVLSDDPLSTGYC